MTRDWFGRIRRRLAYHIYTPPEPLTEDGGLSTRGIVDYALDTNEKRDIIRTLATRSTGRRHYSDTGNGKHVGAFLSAVRNHHLDIPENADRPQRQSAREARLTTVILPELAAAKVIEVTADDEPWTTDAADLTGDITRVRPGVRFEFAAQALRWIDENGSQYDWTPPAANTV